MKKIEFAVVLFVSTIGIAQNSAEVELEISKMDQALKYGDKQIAVSKMYNIIALQGPKSVYKDSLAYLYFSERNYLSCFLVTNDVLESSPNNMEMLEMSAVSLESIGAKDKAAEVYEKLFSKNNTGLLGYKLAALQYGLNRYEEAYATIIKAGKTPVDTVTTFSFKVNDNYSQDVPLAPSIAYLEGVIAEALDKKAEAKIAYERALLGFPDFVLVKSSLSALEE
ncbi:MAG: hypothetical protein KAH07_03210 [Flavobacteriaceae bacterium]|nr:hypothetical protein [Flavobacteriaceae bacterium]